MCKHIFHTYRGYQDIDFINKILPKNVEKCCKNMMNKYYVHIYCCFLLFWVQQTLIEHYVTKNFNKL